jgi:hypothetical protein
MVAVTVLVDPKEDVHRSSCRSYHEDGVIAVSRTVTLIATDPSPVRTAEAMAGGMVS